MRFALTHEWRRTEEVVTASASSLWWLASPAGVLPLEVAGKTGPTRTGWVAGPALALGWRPSHCATRSVRIGPGLLADERGLGWPRGRRGRIGQEVGGGSRRMQRVLRELGRRERSPPSAARRLGLQATGSESIPCALVSGEQPVLKPEKGPTRQLEDLGAAGALDWSWTALLQTAEELAGADPTWAALAKVSSPSAPSLPARQPSTGDAVARLLPAEPALTLRVARLDVRRVAATAKPSSLCASWRQQEQAVEVAR
jgi:hypothetical protein